MDSSTVPILSLRAVGEIVFEAHWLWPTHPGSFLIPPSPPPRNFLSVGVGLGEKPWSDSIARSGCYPVILHIPPTFPLSTLSLSSPFLSISMVFILIFVASFSKRVAFPRVDLADSVSLPPPPDAALVCLASALHSPTSPHPI